MQFLKENYTNDDALSKFFKQKEIHEILEEEDENGDTVLHKLYADIDNYMTDRVGGYIDLALFDIKNNNGDTPYHVLFKNDKIWRPEVRRNKRETMDSIAFTIIEGMLDTGLVENMQGLYINDIALSQVEKYYDEKTAKQFKNSLDEMMGE